MCSQQLHGNLGPCNHLTQLLDKLGVETAPNKIVRPTHRIEFLGVIADAKKMTLEMPEDKIQEVKHELHTWLYRTAATRKGAESLVGKLQFMGKVIKLGRVFISRLINWMKTLDRTGKHTIPMEANRDVAWWGRFIQD